LIGSEHVATTDTDLLWDALRSLRWRTLPGKLLKSFRYSMVVTSDDTPGFSRQYGSALRDVCQPQVVLVPCCINWRQSGPSVARADTAFAAPGSPSWNILTTSPSVPGNDPVTAGIARLG
jgi:hypothetical protein